MLSYRHHSHAGNVGDVLKHLVLVRLLEHLAGADGPLFYAESHAGAGSYALDTEVKAANRAWDSGIGRLWSREGLPPPVADYVAAVRDCNARGELSRYPGSPWLAARRLRPGDRMLLHELQPEECAALRALLRDDARAEISQADGFSGCAALEPPPGSRPLMLLDPPHQPDLELAPGLEVLRAVLARSPSAVIALWYPLRSEGAGDETSDEPRAPGGYALTRIELLVRGSGMRGCGLLVANAPPALIADMRIALPYLAWVLGRDGAGDWRLAAPAAG